MIYPVLAEYPHACFCEHRNPAYDPESVEKVAYRRVYNLGEIRMVEFLSLGG